MPSPFPGMNPYLEGEVWYEFHNQLAQQLSNQLMPLLAPKYVALLNKRYVIDRSVELAADEITTQSAFCHVRVVGAPEPTPPSEPKPNDIIAHPTVELPNLLPDEIAQLNVEIRDVAQRRLVTIIEILSPANKVGTGASDYYQRRVETLHTQPHLLEIDLLRRGSRISLVGEPPPAPYYVYLSRWQRRPFTQVWPLPLRHPLPTIPVPLLPSDPDVPLDLQLAVKTCFDNACYDELLDYTAPLPPPPFVGDDAVWVDQIVHTHLARACGGRGEGCGGWGEG